jgi:hypothetical protein
MRSSLLAADDLAVEEQKEEMEIESDAEDRAASPGTPARATGATAHPAPFAFAAPPAFVSPTTAPPPDRLQRYLQPLRQALGSIPEGQSSSLDCCHQGRQGPQAV